jgi:hypothetical protein
MANLPEIKMSDEVIDAINDELLYQSQMSDTDRADKEDYGLAGQLVALKHYTDDTLFRWTVNRGSEESLDSLRKVAATAIRALEQYGCPRRNRD